MSFVLSSLYLVPRSNARKYLSAKIKGQRTSSKNRFESNSRRGRTGMKRTFLSALIGVGIVVAILQIFPGSKAAQTPSSYLLVRRGPESFKNDSPAPFPTPAGTVHIPLPAETYPLTCRGGGSLVIGIAPGERNIGFVFTRGTKPAGITLAPGECSWTDRGMNA